MAPSARGAGRLARRDQVRRTGPTRPQPVRRGFPRPPSRARRGSSGAGFARTSPTRLPDPLSDRDGSPHRPRRRRRSCPNSRGAGLTDRTSLRSGFRYPLPVPRTNPDVMADMCAGLQLGRPRDRRSVARVPLPQNSRLLRIGRVILPLSAGRGYAEPAFKYCDKHLYDPVQQRGPCLARKRRTRPASAARPTSMRPVLARCPDVGKHQSSSRAASGRVAAPGQTRSRRPRPFGAPESRQSPKAWLSHREHGLPICIGSGGLPRLRPPAPEREPAVRRAPPLDA